VSSTILTDIVRDYEAISTAWFSALSPIAHRIFWVLVAIQLTWTAMWWALDREDGLGALASLLREHGLDAEIVTPAVPDEAMYAGAELTFVRAYNRIRTSPLARPVLRAVGPFFHVFARKRAPGRR